VQLEALNIALRSRSSWEAIDLGFGLVRRHARDIYTAWFLTVLPLFLFLSVALQDHPWLVPLLFWWCKPFYDRVVLFVLSRAIFDERTTARQALGAVPGLLRTGLLSQLTLLRIPSFTRSFTLPVWQLEGLRGRIRRRRQGVLQIRARPYAVWLTLVCVGFEFIVWLGLYGLIWLLLPAHLDFDLPDLLFRDDPAYWVSAVQAGMYFLVVSLIEPLFVAGGFTLYLNRRTQLEGWDIEIVFRRLAQRLAALRAQAAALFLAPLAALLLAALLTLGLPAPVQAQEGQAQVGQAQEQQTQELPTREEPGEEPAAVGETVNPTRLSADRAAGTIEAVLAAKDFGHQREVLRWRFKPREDDGKNTREDSPEFGEFFEDLAELLATLTRASLWFLLGLAVLLLIVYRDRWLGLITGRRRRQPGYRPPDTLFGLDLRADSLPEDIAAAARTLWQAGRHREAMSLLYRGALAALVHREGLALHDSHTEGDILALARQAISAPRHQYLAELTGVWQLIAYAHREPESTQSQRLLAQWQTHFAGDDGEAAA